MPSFEPFYGVRYNTDLVDPAAVVAPPYDVVGAAEQLDLEARSPFNVVHIDVTRNHLDTDLYDAARCRFQQWLDQGVLMTDAVPGFYVYSMGFRDADGRLRQTIGVMGALALAPPGTGPSSSQVLPHERTLSKAKEDRLQLMRACRANLSPVWCLSLAAGLSELCVPSGPPLARCTDEDGVHHRLWTLTQAAVVEAVRARVASAPVVIADGHHRYETALTYRQERRAANGDQPGDYDRLLTLVVELAPDHLGVAAIHRLINGLPDDYDLLGALTTWFKPTYMGAIDDRRSIDDQRHLMLLTPRGRWALDRGDSSGAADEPDAALLDEVFSSLPGHRLSFDHRVAEVTAAVVQGRAQAGFLLRPVAVDQIAAAARAGRRMPEKTTFFHPKPRTGMVFRHVID